MSSKTPEIEANLKVKGIKEYVEIIANAKVAEIVSDVEAKLKETNDAVDTVKQTVVDTKAEISNDMEAKLKETNESVDNVTKNVLTTNTEVDRIRSHLSLPTIKPETDEATLIARARAYSTLVAKKVKEIMADKSEDLSRDYVKTKLSELTSRHTALWNKINKLGSEERKVLRSEIDEVHAEMEAYRDILTGIVRNEIYDKLARLTAYLNVPKDSKETDTLEAKLTEMIDVPTKELRESLAALIKFINASEEDLTENSETTLNKKFSEIMNERDERYDERFSAHVTRDTIWSREYINALPDTAFAIVESDVGIDKLKNTMRDLPFKNSKGTIDSNHLIRALELLAHVDVNAEVREAARRKLCGAVNAYNRTHDEKLESAVCASTSEKRKQAMQKSEISAGAMIEHLEFTNEQSQATAERLDTRLKVIEDFMDTVVKPTHERLAESKDNEGNDKDKDKGTKKSNKPIYAP